MNLFERVSTARRWLFARKYLSPLLSMFVDWPGTYFHSYRSEGLRNHGCEICRLVFRSRHLCLPLKLLYVVGLCSTIVVLDFLLGMSGNTVITQQFVEPTRLLPLR